MQRLITRSYHEVVTEANNGKSPVEAALVKEPVLPHKKCNMFHLAQRNMCQHREAPMSPSQDQRNDGSPSSSLDDGEAFFTKLD
ncbi:hypothetical protein Q3G72_012821 [Acer saccharum]|nr:hypothetical protein Q3G72_012821 [Acer saccharum]